MRVLCFDTESTDLKAMMGRILCASFAWMTVNREGDMKVGKPWTFRGDTLNDLAEGDITKDEWLVLSIRDQLEEADCIVGWNSKLHDIPLLNARLAKWGHRGFNPHLHLDLMWYAGGNSMKIGSRKLDNVAKYFQLPVQKCVVADTPVLTADLRWVEAGNLVPGMKLLAFEEEGPSRKWVVSEVVENTLSIAATKEVVLRSGETVFTTYDHPWLVGRLEAARWQTTKGMNRFSGNRASYPLNPVKVWKSNPDCWMGGFLDGEGCWSNGRISFAQNHGHILDRALGELAKQDFEYSVTDRQNLNHTISQVHVQGGYGEQLRALGIFQPQRLIANLTNGVLPRLQSKTRDQVVAIFEGGRKTIAELTTTSKTYVANGYCMHNTPISWDDWQRAGAGVEAAMDTVVKHCEHDVRVLGEAYKHLMPYVRNVHR